MSGKGRRAAAPHPQTFAGRLLRAELRYGHQECGPTTDSHSPVGVGECGSGLGRLGVMVPWAVLAGVLKD